MLRPNDTDHSHHKSCRTCLTNHMGSISQHIWPLVNNSLEDRYTCKTHTPKQVSWRKAILRNQTYTWFNQGRQNQGGKGD